MGAERESVLFEATQRTFGIEAFNKAKNNGEKTISALGEGATQFLVPFSKWAIEPSPGYTSLLKFITLGPAFITDVAFDFGPAIALALSNAPALAYPLVILGTKLLYNGVGSFVEAKSGR